MKFYAGIGSRETPDDVIDLMTALGFALMDAGYTLRTGIAPGADQAFARGAGCEAQWSLPWPTFEQPFQDEMRDKQLFAREVVLPTEAEESITSHFHPAWDRLSQGARKLHARNVLQMLGPLTPHECSPRSTPSSFVVCWTKDGKASGGTGQAIRIAQAYGIPVRNLQHTNHRAAAELFLEGKETA